MSVTICLFSHKSVSVSEMVREEVWGEFSIPGKCSVRLRSGFCGGHSRSPTPILANHVFNVMRHCHGGTGLGTLVLVKDNCNATVYKYFLYNRVLCGNS